MDTLFTSIIVLVVAMAALVGMSYVWDRLEDGEGTPSRHEKAARKEVQQQQQSEPTRLTRAPCSAPVSRPGSRPRTGAATPMIAPERYVVALPSLVGLKLQPEEMLTLKITTAVGGELIEVQVWRPLIEPDFPSNSATEYVCLTTPGGGEEVAMLAFLGEQCQVFQGGDVLFGGLQKISPNEFHLVSSSSFGSGVVLRCVGEAAARQMSVFGAGGEKLATVEPSAAVFSSGSHYQVTCEPQADVGLVVVALLGIDRILVHSGMA